MTQNCKWIIKPNSFVKNQDGSTTFVPGEICGAKVTYKMVEDGGEPGAAKHRKYSTFCEKHQQMADTQEDLD